MPSDENLTVRLGADLKAKWVALCKSRGIKPTTALKIAITEEIAATPLPQFVEQIGEIDDGPRARFVLHLSPTENEAIRLRASAEGVSPQFWVIRAVRAQLTGSYQVTNDAVQGAAQLHKELLSIGRNINQVARALNLQSSLNSEDRARLAAMFKQSLDALSHLRSKLSEIISSYSVRFALKKVVS